MLETIFPILTVVLLPIVPSLLLFKLLPETDGWLGGGFHGLEFKFGGAFAGYLLVMWVVHGYLPPPDYQIWTVEGKIPLEEHDAYDDLRVFVIGNERPVSLSGHLQFRFLHYQNGFTHARLPDLVIEAAGRDYEFPPVPLGAIEPEGRHIYVGEIRARQPEADEPYVATGELRPLQGETR